ncbi:hypothetical protein [Rickettsiella massiliensis]|uniref:hypothetical protein n=1 Tax=Rickettsiella massiliensis TaxID=676517 RepID=UPI00029AF2DC|nr:hypothetical protein [Rickettsiella massiliensis]
MLTGLDPVKRRPGMYTDTARPNHLAPDNSLEVIDDGRGMPVDIHPEEKITGVELILTRLHAGAKI